MSNVVPLEFDTRAMQALACLQQSPELRRAVWGEANAFFLRHPEIERTEFGMAFVACALLDAWGGSEAAKPSPKTKAA